MATLVSRNTIQLASSASTTTDYYKGYTIIVTRLDKITGKKSIQKMQIVSYSGASRIATVEGVWAENEIPDAEDANSVYTYEIVPTYADSRVSINPAMQTMDYITSNRYGRNLNPLEDLYIPSWLESARICDTPSDITIEYPSGTLPSVGAIYKYPSTGTLLWRGTVHSISGRFVRFTNVIGKLTNQWKSWKNYPLNTIVYNSNRLYLVTTAGIKATEPTHTTGTVNGLQFRSSAVSITKVSGTGPSSMAMPFDGNPIRAKNSAGEYISGYSLYDADGLDYWRYLGWDSHDQRWVTQHQTNLTIDTSVPIFDNTNSLLEHFGGILRYTAGKYYLEIEQAESGIQQTNDPRYISTDDIIDRIRISDDGIKTSYNSLTVAFADPANKYEARNISFFNSNYLKIDRNVSKKGNLGIPGITNYYNARLLADRVLTKSRFGLTVSFNMSPKGALLLAGRVIQLPYSRYGWTNKPFRISNLTHNPDCSVDIVATEYDDNFYAVKPMQQPPATGTSIDRPLTTVGSPTNLIATSDTTNNEGTTGITISWTHPTPLTVGSTYTELYMSESPNFLLNISSSTATVLTTGTAHGLKVGNAIKILSGTNTNLINGITYYVASVPSSTTFTLAASKNGANITVTASPGATDWILSTAVLLDAIPYPENTYFDPYVGGDSSRIARYYWVRYKIIGQ